MRRIFVILLLVVIGITAGAQKKKDLSTQVNLNYCLPKVVYNVIAELECTSLIPGPYQSYAEKELGIRPEITEARKQWKVVKIDIKPQYIPDEKAVYSVAASGDYYPLMLSLSAEGFLAGVSAGKGGIFDQSQKMKFVVDEEIRDENIDILKMNTYNPLKEVLDTNYTFQEIDGVMKKIWDPIVRYSPKTQSDNVKEALSEIFRIRSERSKLLGAENNVPDGKSLEIILKEFDRMENDYLSLFLGKKETVHVRKVFQCTPVKAGEPVVAFRLSEREGITDLKNVAGQVYLLKIDDVVVPASKPVAGEAASSAIYYRVPAMGELKLMKGKEELVSFQTIVPQLGEIKKIPLDVISSEAWEVEFYPQYGALKSIKKQ